jgi:hypothetical protein
MKSYLIFILLILTSTKANAWGGTKRHHKKRYHDRPEYLFIGGLKADLTPHGLLLGSEVLPSRNMIGCYYAGAQIGYSQGHTDLSYGYSTPWINLYTLTTNNIGINNTFLIYYKQKVALSLSLLVDFEWINLGDRMTKYRFSDNYGYSTFSNYHTLNTDLFYTFRPMLNVYVGKNFGVSGTYNFMMSIGAPNYGKTSDFQGPELMLYFKNNRRSKRKYPDY